MRPILVALCMLVLASSASAALINYYSFDSGTPMVDEAALYAQNGGANNTDLTFGDPAAKGMTLVTGRDGTGSAIYVRGNGGNGTGFGQAIQWPGGDADIALGSNFTIEMWINSGTGRWGDYTNVQFLLANNMNINVTDSGVGGNETVTVGGGAATMADWSAGVWHHLAIVVSGGTSLQTYWDGVASGSATIPSLGTTTSLRMGNPTATTVYPSPVPIDAWIDDIAMWNQALSGSAIASHYAGGGGAASYGLTPVPEPASMGLLVIGGLAMLARSRKRK